MIIVKRGSHLLTTDPLPKKNVKKPKKVNDGLWNDWNVKDDDEELLED